MELLQIQIGDKVIPISKSRGCNFVDDSIWKIARQSGHFCLVVNGIDGEEITCGEVLSGNPPKGNLYLPADLIPYSDNERDFLFPK